MVQFEAGQYPLDHPNFSQAFVISRADGDHEIIYVNDVFSKITQYSQSETIGRNCRFLQGPDSSKVVRRAIHTGLEQRFFIEADIVNYRKDQSVFLNRLSISPIFDSYGRVSHFIGVQRDVTAEVDGDLFARQQVISRLDSAKFWELAILARGLSHNLNNPLSILQGYQGRLRKELAKLEEGPAKAKMLEYLDACETPIKRISALGRHLMNLSPIPETESTMGISFESLRAGLQALINSKVKSIATSLDFVSATPSATVLAAPDCLRIISLLYYESLETLQSLPKGWIKIVIELTADLLIIRYSDSCPGARSDGRQSFIPFHSESPSSTGLALARVKFLTEARGGSVRIDDRDELMITLPNNDSNAK